MARPIWKGSIAFGLVNIPVELYTAVRDSYPRFRMLHAENRSPVKFERVCAREGKPVAWEELVKGYEYEKGRFVVLTKEDFRAAALEKSRTVDIRSVVDGKEIDDRFFETSQIIKAKMKGKEPRLTEHVEPRPAEVVDLMERLRQSLEGAGTKTGAKKPARAKKTAARGKRTRAA